MEIKKTPKADLENKKSTWLLVDCARVYVRCIRMDKT
jgi:hypothetical protein